MELLPEYDVAIVGGGLAGLAVSILLRKKGYTVVLFEKEAYPFHKVCGEYISLESWSFLQSLGLRLSEWNLPRINSLQLTAPNGRMFETRLPLGGFGISRHRLDGELAMLAKNAGVHLLEKTKVDNIVQEGKFLISLSKQTVKATICLAAYGKRSNIDVKWNRDFLQAQDKRLNNFVGVKYHIKTAWPQGVIGLHNFENGYCGISEIEDGKYCLCYITRADNLKQNGNSIQAMQENTLFQNPHIEKIFQKSEILQDFPITISQISFASKTKVQNGVLMLGDTAGMITPLCGNGMSIALHTAKIAASLTDEFLQKKLSAARFKKEYSRQWEQQFSSRLHTGRVLQKFFGSKGMSNFFVGAFQTFPFLAKPVIQLTHGEPF